MTNERFEQIKRQVELWRRMDVLQMDKIMARECFWDARVYLMELIVAATGNVGAKVEHVTPSPTVASLPISEVPDWADENTRLLHVLSQRVLAIHEQAVLIQLLAESVQKGATPSE